MKENNIAGEILYGKFLEAGEDLWEKVIGIACGKKQRKRKIHGYRKIMYLKMVYESLT